MSATAKTYAALRAARRDFRAAQRAQARHPGPLGRAAFLAAQDAMTAAHHAHMAAHDRKRSTRAA